MKDILKQVKCYIKTLNNKQKLTALLVLVLSAFAAAIMAFLTVLKFF